MRPPAHEREPAAVPGVDRPGAGAPAPANDPEPAGSGGYQPARPPAVASIGFVGGMVALGALALTTLAIVPPRQPAHRPMVVDLLPLATPPPPERTALPTQRVAPQPAPPRPVVAPPPIVTPPATPTQPRLETVPVPPPQPQQASPAAPPAPAPAAAGPIAVDDLGTRLLSAPPPRYPTESRRRREEGVVVLRVVVAEDGRAESVSIQAGSGHPRLDDAARGAVRRWRWTPTIRGGAAVRVEGVVRIPFRLTGGEGA